jgi:hypothetical protein
LEESDTFECLCRAHAYWLEERYADGIVRALAHLEVILCKRSRQAKKDPEHFQRKVLPAALMGDLVKRIRAGHRSPTPEVETTEVQP